MSLNNQTYECVCVCVKYKIKYIARCCSAEADWHFDHGIPHSHVPSREHLYTASGNYEKHKTMIQ